MSFTSGARRNDDPFPWRAAHPGFSHRVESRRSPARYRYPYTYSPRPEFDLPARADANPILRSFRADAVTSVGADAGGFIETVGTLADHWLTSDATGNGYATQAEHEHASKVFARLSRLYS